MTGGVSLEKVVGDWEANRVDGDGASLELDGTGGGNSAQYFARLALYLQLCRCKRLLQTDQHFG